MIISVFRVFFVTLRTNYTIMAQKVLFITQEIAPYVADSAMSTLGRKLAASVVTNNCDIRTFMPKWGHINERRGQLHEVIRLSGLNINIDETDHPLLIKVASISTVPRMQVYFIDNSDYFKHRLMRVDEAEQEYADNVERSIFYARGVLETVKKLRWFPDYVVCQGWMSYLIPFYIRTAYSEEPAFANCKVVSTFFREQLTTGMPSHLARTISFREGNEERLAETGIDFTAPDALQRLAIKFSDGLMNVAAPKELTALLEESKRPYYKVKTLDTLGADFPSFLASLS